MTTPSEPLMPALNVAVLQLVGHMRIRYRMIPDDPKADLDGLRAMCAAGEYVIWAGCSDRTIFADREVNWAFRAWHDHAHVRGGFDYSLGGERRTAELQCADIFALYGRSDQARDMAALVLCEVIGQAEFYHWTGAFPEDQWAFAQDHWHEFMIHADRLMKAEAALVQA